MKKRNILCVIALSCAFAFSATACEVSASQQPMPNDNDEDMSDVIMLNGNAAPVDNVIVSDGNIYTLDLCFAVPYGTDMEERAGDTWTTLKTDSKWNGFTVSEASSGYDTAYYSNKSKSLVVFQEVHLNGNITVNTSAEYLDKERGITDVIVLSPDEASRSVLPSLYPYFEDRTSEYKHYSEEGIYFTINSENEYFRQIADKIDAGEDFTVTVTADAFMLQWTDYGLVTDGVTNGRFENILDLSVN